MYVCMYVYIYIYIYMSFMVVVVAAVAATLGFIVAGVGTSMPGCVHT